MGSAKFLLSKNNLKNELYNSVDKLNDLDILFLSKNGGMALHKSMYSLILFDEVVQKIDEIAYQHGLSRSAMVNQILAEYVSCLTPQQRIESIFQHLAETVKRGGLLQVKQTSGSMLLLRSALNYRYNPTIRYSVEFGTEVDGYFCLFKVVTRTQSEDLLRHLTFFYRLWCQVEGEMLQGRTNADLCCQIRDGSFSRRLLVEQAGNLPDSHRVGRAIGDYISLFDKALKLSFAAEGDQNRIYQNTLQLYRHYLSDCEMII